jgi:GNAT superfamily N-acetyltransferase
MTQWISERLTADHDLSQFDCGNDGLNEWLRKVAVRAQGADTARTYVWTQSRTENAVLAYYSVAPTQVLRAEVSSAQAGGFSVVPAYLLARLALDRSLHGQGLGSELLMDALETIVMASDTSSGRLIVVDAVDDSAAAFYAHHDFTPIKGDDRRLVMKVSTARRALGMVKMSVTGDQQIRLVSMLFEMPNGTTVPVILSATEVDIVLEKIEEALSGLRENEDEAQINVSQILREVLGRDPFRT